MASSKKDAAPAKALPKNLADAPMGALADALYDLRERRLALDSRAALLKADETRIKDFLIRTLPKAQLKKLAGKRGAVSLSETLVPHITSWEKLRAYVQKQGAFDLLQKRPSAEAFRERWDRGVDIPGVEKFKVIDLSVRKAG